MPVIPGLLRGVLPAYEHRLGLPVVALPGQERPSLQPENLRTIHGEPVPERPAPGSCPDDDNVVVLVICHAGSLLERGLPVSPAAARYFTMSRADAEVITRRG